MNFLQDRRVLWGGAVIIVLIVLAVVYGWPGGETSALGQTRKSGVSLGMSGVGGQAEVDFGRPQVCF